MRQNVKKKACYVVHNFQSLSFRFTVLIVREILLIKKKNRSNENKKRVVPLVQTCKHTEYEHTKASTSNKHACFV